MIARQVEDGKARTMVHIDGSQRSGSGTIVRFATVLAVAHGRPVHVFNARVRRPKPGLRPQHLTTVRALAEVCDGTLTGAAVDSREFVLTPGRLRGGRFKWDIGTAGSATMLALGILPVACLAPSALTARITGGVFQDSAPSPFHLQHVLLPLLRRMGIEAELEVIRPGLYLPSGGGEIELRTRPVRGPLTAIHLGEPGIPRDVAGIALASRLAERRVADRMAETCEAALASSGVGSRIERRYDETASHAGAALAIWATTSTGCRLGADRAGAPRRTSETIGRSVAAALFADLATGATVDRHLADQLVLFAALAKGSSEWIVPQWTEHVESNLWLAERFGAAVRRGGHRVEIGGVPPSS